ncbi:MAG TPA: cytochrome c [Chitinophagaceae bacterium]|nr:cytochrome c [Chitinophagaceae bacterium]
MFNQTRYILNALCILLTTVVVVFLFLKIIETEAHPDNNGKINAGDDTTAPKIANSRGKQLFQTNCASCHAIFKDIVGPALYGLEQRGPWADRKKLYAWINNPPKFMASDNYTLELKKRFGVTMTGFSLSEKDIDTIVEYINSASTEEYMPVAKAGDN